MTASDSVIGLPRSDVLSDKVLDAAGRAVARVGIHKVSMDDIAAEAKMSRATLYRRYGSRDAIIAALISQQARPFVEDSIRLSVNAKSFTEQLEINTVQAVLNIGHTKPCLPFFLRVMIRKTLSLFDLCTESWYS